MAKIRERDLTKGQLRKLTALRKSLGKGIADNAFAEWLASVPAVTTEPADNNAEAIAELLDTPVLTKKINLPRGGYVVRRGRGRVVVERAKGSPARQPPRRPGRRRRGPSPSRRPADRGAAAERLAAGSEGI